MAWLEHAACLLQTKKRYESSSKINTTGIEAKVAKDPEGYHHLQTHVSEQNTFIGKNFTRFLVLYSMNSTSNTIPSIHLDWNTNFK
ncbi:hypothetical protein VP01_1056g4 [Puccinia sorghi]|uniref:Uncharacterized protein n=1 Tax=Puccinia sorghi TaxID=27349 RepID=A0A0L6VU04_9BASI|nr:hypothetical protein VP01_1056g4 [Puccinia sorghi]